MRHMIRNTLFLGVLLALSSCAKEEFATNKGGNSNSTSQALSSSLKLCTQSTLVSPQVDILMLWDNSTSFNIVTPDTRKSMGNLINTVSERFDYHILSAPLISVGSTSLSSAQLVTKNNTGLSGDALNIIRSKETAASSLSFPLSNSGAEPGVDRAIQIIEQNRANGIFRQNAYTMVIVISNEDDDSCESETGLSSCSYGSWEPRMKQKINRLINVKNSLGSSMMRFINISPLSPGGCTLDGVRVGENFRYRMVANEMYSINPSKDHLAPDLEGAFDSYNLCKKNFSSIFAGIETSIKQTLILHKYDYWPVAGAAVSLDPDSIRVVRTDGKILANRTGETSPSDGYSYVGVQNRNTRYAPSAGEPFNGKMIQLHGTEGSDLVVYPQCLTITYTEEKLTYGYYYLPSKPVESSIEVSLNGARVPQSASNGWDLMGFQYTSALDSSLKIVNLPTGGASSGYFIRFNGSYKVKNTSVNNFDVRYISAAVP